MLEQHLSQLTVRTPGRGLVEITDEVRARVAASGIRNGLLTLFVRHTSASLLIQENADPDVRIYLWSIACVGTRGRWLRMWLGREMGRRASCNLANQ